MTATTATAETGPAAPPGGKPKKKRRSKRESSGAARFKPGDQIDQYELIRELGRGGMGAVFLARDLKLSRLVAIKFLLLGDEKFRSRFVVEARTTAQCSHENIVVIHAVDEYEGIPYMVLEYLEGQSLGALRKQQHITPSRAVELMVPVVRALVRANQFKIIHRDLKPDNIFVTNSGIVKVLDFGIAKLIHDDLGQGDISEYLMPPPLPTPPPPVVHAAREDELVLDDLVFEDDDSSLPLDSGDSSGSYVTLSGGGNVVGTPVYMSPEQWGIVEAGAEVGAATDIWATGVILYVLLTRKHPVAMPPKEANLLHELRNLQKPLKSLATIAPQVPERLVRIVDRCLQKKVEDRYGSAQELLEELEKLLPNRQGGRINESECPYPGLVAFQEKDTDRYFGRDQEIRRATTRMQDQPLLVIVGPSGVGKSSFVRAGVVPALKRDGWISYSVRPGRRPLESLAAVMQEVNADFTVTVEEVAQRLRTHPGNFGQALRQYTENTFERVLLFVDQFEELYTLVADDVERVAFTNALRSVADDVSSPSRVMLSMRSDFLDRAAEERVFFEELSRGLFFLPPVDRKGLRDVLVEPAALHGYGFESEAMVDAMIDELEATPGALPLLQFAAGSLWQGRDVGRKILTEETLKSLGGIAGTLASHADQILGGLSPRMRQLVRAIFERLVTPERTRAIVDLEELRGLSDKPAEIEQCIDLLVSSRLLLVQTRGESDGAFVEIVHESLLESWPTLKKWLEESAEHAVFLDQLRFTAAQWEERGRPAGLLWRGEAIAEARRFQDTFTGELVARERDYLGAVMFAANRSARLRKIAITAVMVVLGGMVAVGAVVIVTISQAEKEAQQATLEAQRQSALAATETEKAKEAEKRVLEQLKTIQEKEKARELAEAEAAKAGAQVASSRAELANANVQLRSALVDAEKLKSDAQAAARKAKEAEKKERLARQERETQAKKLEKLLANERKRVKNLERERKKILTELK
jgi:serine/threonine protein kinase